MQARLRSLFAQFRNKERWLVAAALLVLFAAHATMLRAVVQNGDTAVYNDQIDARDFDSCVMHIGYKLVGGVFHALLPFQTDLGMNVMALAFGIGTLFAVYLTGVRLGSRVAGVSGVAFLLCAGEFVRAMLLAEVDILEVSLVTLSLTLYLRGRERLAGVLFGVAMLVTPLSATTLPLFVCSFALLERGPRASLGAHARRVFWFALCSLAVYVPVVAWHFHEYVYGPRSLTTAERLHFNLAQQAARSWKSLTAGSWAVAALYLAGILSALTDRRIWRLGQLGLAVVLSVVVTLVVGDRTRDVPVQLPNVVILCLLAGLFVHRLAAIRRFAMGKLAWALPLAALVFVAPEGYVANQREIADDVHLRDTYRSMAIQSQPLELVLVGPSGFMRTHVFKRYAASPGARTLSAREFYGSIRAQQQAPATAKIWFWSRVPAARLAPLKASYQLTSLTAGGRSFQVLVPRAPAR
jgi:4-amino-4-deoxy-L-arabinose transferase-like glycosyltransferase